MNGAPRHVLESVSSVAFEWAALSPDRQLFDYHWAYFLRQDVYMALLCRAQRQLSLQALNYRRPVTFRSSSVDDLLFLIPRHHQVSTSYRCFYR